MFVVVKFRLVRLFIFFIFKQLFIVKLIKQLFIIIFKPMFIVKLIIK